MSQTAIPVKDLSRSGWTPYVNGVPSPTSFLYKQINEDRRPGNPNFARSVGDPAPATFEVELNRLGVPQDLAGEHVLTIRLRKTDTGDVPVLVQLFRGSVLVGAWPVPPAGSFTDERLTLSAQQIGLLYSNPEPLRLIVSAGPPLATGWVFNAFDGASWSGDQWVVRISYQNSQNCGGPNPNIQNGTASCTVNLPASARLTVQMRGLVEGQDSGYEHAQVTVDTTVVCSADSVGHGLGCTMLPRETSGSIDLAAGTHEIQIFSSTVDGQYHVGAYWEFTFLWQPL